MPSRFDPKPDNFQDEEWEIEPETHANEKRRKTKKRLDELQEQKRLRESIGMDDTHSYWDEL